MPMEKKKMDRLMSSPSSLPPSAGQQPPSLPQESFPMVSMHGKQCDEGQSRGSVREDDSHGLPPNRESVLGSSDSSFRMLAESVRRFGEIWEKLENTKRQQMAEIERMKREFQRDLRCKIARFCW